MIFFTHYLNFLMFTVNRRWFLTNLLTLLIFIHWQYTRSMGLILSFALFGNEPSISLRWGLILLFSGAIDGLDFIEKLMKLSTNIWSFFRFVRSETLVNLSLVYLLGTTSIDIFKFELHHCNTVSTNYIIHSTKIQFFLILVKMCNLLTKIEGFIIKDSLFTYFFYY